MTTKTTLGQRYHTTFEQLKTKNQGAFVPFVMVGDPTAELSFDIIKTLIDNGADALELGIPFSDPSADGVTIQQAGLRALKRKVTTDTCLEVLTKVREYAPEIPVGLLIYANLIFARGLNDFYADVAKAGVDSVLVADLPIRESQPFIDAATQHNVAPIFIAPPNASKETLKKVAELGQGYTYVLSRAGVTGTETKAEMPASDLISTLNDFKAPPGVLGFGISQPEQVSQAIKSGANGAISGSATVKIIEQNLNNPALMLEELAKFTKKMKQATHFE